MSSRYEEALEAKLATLDNLETVSGAEDLVWLIQDMGMDFNIESDLKNAKYFIKTIKRTLAIADPYYWTEEVLQALEAVWPTLDDITITRDDVPCISGFLYFPRWIRFKDTRPMKALSWIPYRREGDSDVLLNPKIRDDTILEKSNGLAFICWAEAYEDSKLLLPMSYLLHAFDTPLDMAVLQTRECVPSSVSESDIQDIEEFTVHQLKFIMSAFLFLNQPAFTVTATPLSRAARRRVERRKKANDPKAVNVIYLRKSRAEPSGETRDVAWKSRWWVRLHFRTYRDEAGKVTKRRLIFPYTKGPAHLDTPPPKPHVFAVVR